MRFKHFGASIKKISVLILAFIVMAGFFLPWPVKCAASETYDIDGVIGSCFKAMEDENGNVLSGDILSSAGSAGADWIAFAAGRYGKDDAYGAYLRTLENYVTSCYRDNGYGLSSSKATEWHRIALTVLALGGNPENFGTDAAGSPVNLIADGTYACKAGEPWKQGINGAAYALIVLDSIDCGIPDGALYTREDCIDYILKGELPGGGFSLGGNEADADVTAIALQALAPYYKAMPEVKEAVDAALARLSQMQLEKGGFPSYGQDNAESAAQVLIALSALGIDALGDDRFISDGGKTVLDGLMAYYDKAGGGFCHVDGGGIDTMATSQSLCALISYQRLKDGLPALYDLDINPAGEDIRGTEDTEEKEVSQTETDIFVPPKKDGGEPGPTRVAIVIISIAVIAAAVAGIAVYFKKLRRRRM